MGKIYVQMTNGFGNNIFQYVAARLLGEYHNLDVIAIPPHHNYYAISCLEKLGIKFGEKQEENLFVVDDTNYIHAFKKQHNDCNFFVNGFFEDYKYYIKMKTKIKNWFPEVKKRNDNDLVIHLRAGDRLFYKNEFYTKPKAEDYLRAMEKYEFDQIHIVTDMPEWKVFTETDLKSMKFHVSIPKDISVPVHESMAYINSIVNALSKFNPIVKKRTIVDDFNFIRSFNNILFQHGTLGWWAAFLSDANKVGVYGQWRPWKGTSNKNLANVPLDEWFKWG